VGRSPSGEKATHSLGPGKLPVSRQWLKSTVGATGSEGWIKAGFAGGCAKASATTFGSLDVGRDLPFSANAPIFIEVAPEHSGKAIREVVRRVGPPQDRRCLVGPRQGDQQTTNEAASGGTAAGDEEMHQSQRRRFHGGGRSRRRRVAVRRRLLGTPTVHPGALADEEHQERRQEPEGRTAASVGRAGTPDVGAFRVTTSASIIGIEIRQSSGARGCQMIEVACNCGQRFSVSDDHAGKRGRCKACGRVVSIPMSLGALDIELQPESATDDGATSPAPSQPNAPSRSAPRAQPNRANRGAGSILARIPAVWIARVRFTLGVLIVWGCASFVIENVTDAVRVIRRGGSDSSRLPQEQLCRVWDWTAPSLFGPTSCYVFDREYQVSRLATGTEFLRHVCI
jgi:hypothetical protein